MIERMWRKPSAKPCPKCGQPDAVVPIVYGYPDPKMEMAEYRGEIVLGGCWVGGIDPIYACRRCHIGFDFERPELAPDEVAQRGWVERDEGPEQFEDEGTASLL